METIKIRKPDDFHLHLRDGEMLKAVAGISAKQVERAVVMPNLTPPITTVAQASCYKNQILKALPQDSTFKPLMTLYLSPKTRVQDILAASDDESIVGVKFYPSNTTTNAEHGFASLKDAYPIIEKMEENDLPLLIHGEDPSPGIDIFDREAVFIDRSLTSLVKDFPNLRVILEHASTKEGVDFVKDSGKRVAATLTPQHLLINRNAMFDSKIHPHHFCLPIPKRQVPHQQALVAAAVSGNPKFFMGTDSAPHLRHEKESACGCAGIFTAYAAVEFYATVFEQEDALSKLENFCARFGAEFYQLPLNTTQVTLARKTWRVPPSIACGKNHIIPFMAGKQLRWKFG